jgi:hypothetical protein
LSSTSLWVNCLTQSLFIIMSLSFSSSTKDIFPQSLPVYWPDIISCV